MKIRGIRQIVAGLMLVMTSSAAFAAVSHQEANFDAATMEPFRRKNQKYTSVEQEGKTPGPWQLGSWADNAISEAALVTDAGDGKPAIRMFNVAGQPSAMFKPWTQVTVGRGSWEARAEYRKDGKANGRLTVSGLGAERGVDLSPTGGAFKTVSVPLEAIKNSDIGLTFQLYGGTGPEEALFIRSFRLERVGDVSAATLATEQQANAALNAEAEAVAKREAARRAAERKPIGKWVRPETKPVKMTKPLDPPPVTGKTYYVATSGNNETGDGTQGKPWRSIQHGMNQLHPGDRLYIRGGEYRESMLTFARSGKSDAYITVAGYPGEQAKLINSGGMAVFNLDAGSAWTPKRLHEEAYLVIRDLHIDAVNGNQAIRIHGPLLLDEYKNNLAKSRGLRHNIWIVGCDITGGNGNESVLGSGYGSHDIIISNNRIRDMVGGVNAFLFSDGTIIEWNTVTNTSTDADDAGAIKSMAPGVIIRYNTVHGNNRNPLSKKPGWAPSSEGGAQWRFLQGVSGIYLDWAMLTPQGGNNFYPEALKPADPANYVYGNTVYNNNAGIFAFLSDNAQIYDNVIHSNGRTNSGGWVEGKEGGKWLEFVGPAGYGIAVTGSKNVKVWNNIAYNNPKAGLGTEDMPGLQAFNNVFYGNDLAQVHFRKGDAGAVGFNTILATEKQGPPFRRNKDDFATAEALVAKYPYLEEGTRVVPVKPGADVLAMAQQALKTNAVSTTRWAQARESLMARARAAGIGVPPKTVPQAAFDPTRSLQAPLPWRLPGNVEFENYDVGGPNVSFHDNDGDNQGGHYRKDAVDIKASAGAGNGAVVGFTQNNEWMEYTISVAKAGNYRLSVAYATPETGKRIRLTLNDKPLGETITFAPTASWDDLKTMNAGTVALPAGDSVLRVTVEAGPVDLDRLQFTAAN
jgi:parallel beta-helix repeat protein